MSRQRYLVCYDICDPKRLRSIEKTVKAYGVRIQFSVFECVLDGLRLEKLRAALDTILNSDHDQVLFVSLGPEATDANFRIDALGLPYQMRSRVTIL